MVDHVSVWQVYPRVQWFARANYYSTNAPCKLIFIFFLFLRRLTNTSYGYAEIVSTSPRARHDYHIESPQPPGRPVTAATMRDRPKATSVTINW